MKKLSRREFLKKSGAATAVLAQCPGPAYAEVTGTTAPFQDYKALVCIFMNGGNDSYNMLIPRSNVEYAAYAQSRQNLAVAQQDLLSINPVTPDGTDYGLHRSMGGLQGLFESGRAAFISNVGPLIEPTTKSDYLNKSIALPPQLFSHNDQRDQWYTLKGSTVIKTGWAGRIADLIRTNVTDQQVPTNISLSGRTLSQLANDTIAFVMGNRGPKRLTGLRATGSSAERRLAFQRIINADYNTIYERGYADVQQRAIETVDRIVNALEGVQPLATVFPVSSLGNQLQTVARMIAARDTLNMQRQVFFVRMGGFDLHDNLLRDHPGLLSGISDAMTAFYNATAELGVADNVTSFTQSDFARTLTSNGDGTDHGWGGTQIIVGDAVRGRDMYGAYPNLTIGGPDDVGGGRMIPTTSADQYVATLARWFGIPDENLNIVAPNIDNFALRDLGFLV